MQSPEPNSSDQGFTLIELLVVVIIIGILAAIAVPRFLEARQSAWNATAVSDLRNLIAVQTSLETTSGLSETPATIAAQGWEVSGDSVVVCADLVDDGDDILLASWSVSGNVLYTWRRTDPRVVATELTLPTDCDEAIGGSPTRVD